MMRYKIGDKVRIRRDLSEDIVFVNKAMLQYAGKLATIIRVNHKRGFYDVDIDNKRWTWYDSMFEDTDTEKQGMNKHIAIDVDGNKVIASCGDKEGMARCHPDDDFDFYTGAKLALERLEEAEKPYGWLKKGVRYYFPVPAISDLYNSVAYVADDWDKRVMERGIVFKTKEEAVKCAKKMLAVAKQEG